MQGVVKSYDPESKLGSIFIRVDSPEIELASNALQGSVFQFLRQGQRVVFDLDTNGRATHLRLGSEADMTTPARPPAPRP